MALPTNPQRVALSTDANGKSPQFITREWLRAFSESIGAPGGGTPVDVSALTALIAALTTRVAAAEARIAVLEQGYQI